jgi:hypothetical protein
MRTTDTRPGQHRRRLLPTLILVLPLLLFPGQAAAQKQPAPTQGIPQLYVVMPTGGQAGSTIEVTVSGQGLEEAQSLLFSHPGIKSELLSPPPGAAGTEKADPKKVQGKQQRGQPAMTAALKFKVSIPPDTPLGNVDVRVIAKSGVSNPRAFVVGDLKEVLEKEPNNDVAVAQRVSLNTTVNGTIAAGTDVDYFVFTGKKGQRVLASCLSSSIDSRLHAALEMFDHTGKVLAANRNYNGNDALVDCTLPRDGDYTVRLHEFTYTQGGPDHFYRLSITTAPWIDAVFPPVVEPGKQATVTVYGRNLPGGTPDADAVIDERVLEKMTVTLNLPADPIAAQRLAYRGHVAPPASALDGFEYRVRNASGTSNPFLITLARAPVVLDNQANHTPETAQSLTLPCEVAGRIAKKRDRAWHIFSAHKGDVYTIEAFGDRLGSAIDLYMVVRDAATGKVLTELDDNPDVMNPIQFFTRSEDPPRYRFIAPAGGRYQLMVASREATVQAGPRDLFRVRITPEQPDFRLVVMPEATAFPDACVVRQGGRIHYTIYVWRLDGFDEAITLSAEGLPPGVTCPPQTIGPNVREATLVLAAENNAPPWTGFIKVKGTANVDGKPVVREARPATITWPAPQNIAAISRLDQSLVLAVRDQPPFTLNAGVEQVTAKPGEKVTVPVKVARLQPDFKTPVQLTALGFPSGKQGRNVRQQPVTVNPGKDDGSVVINVPNDAAPGTYSVVIRGEAQGTPVKGAKGRTPNSSVVQASAPITLTVQSKQAAKLDVTPTRPTVKAGKQAELVVKINRKELPGKCRLVLVPPPKVQGISAEEVVVPAGQNEAKLILKVADNAKPGERSGLTVRATGMGQNGKPVVQEATVNVDVSK